MAIVEQGGLYNFYSTFVTQLGEVATISGTPVISIFHRQANSTDVDIVSQNMSVLSGSTYFFRWRPTIRAFKGTYIAKYSAEYSDGTNVVGDEDFQIVTKDHYDKAVGGLVIKGKNGIWTEKEKSKVLDLLEGLAGTSGNFDELNSKLDSSFTVFDEIKTNLNKNVEFFNKDYSSRIDDLILKLSEIKDKQDHILSKEQIVNIDEEKLVANINSKINANNQNNDYSKLFESLNELKEDMKKIDGFDKKMRVPLILSEIEDIRVGFENFQKDLVKIISTNDLERGLFK